MKAFDNKSREITIHQMDLRTVKIFKDAEVKMKNPFICIVTDTKERVEVLLENITIR